MSVETLISYCTSEIEQSIDCLVGWFIHLLVLWSAIKSCGSLMYVTHLGTTVYALWPAGCRHLWLAVQDYHRLDGHARQLV